MTYFYFLTIDKAHTKQGLATIVEYDTLFKKICREHNVHLTDNKYPVQCYEYKSKGRGIYKTNKWIHYHVIVKGQRVYFNSVSYEGYSVKFIRIIDMQDLAIYAGYIQKNMKDEVYLGPNIHKPYIDMRDIKISKYPPEK